MENEHIENIDSEEESENVPFELQTDNEERDEENEDIEESENDEGEQDDDENNDWELEEIEEDYFNKDLYLSSGYVCLQTKSDWLGVAVSSGVAVIIFDKKLKYGGVCHYIIPYRKNGLSTPIFAAPAIGALVNLFLDANSSIDDLEANLYGGTVNPGSNQFAEKLSSENIKVGIEILGKFGITIVNKDVGGLHARKIVFHPGYCEIVAAKIDRFLKIDWYSKVEL